MKTFEQFLNNDGFDRGVDRALNEEDFSQIKPLIENDIKRIRANLFEDSKTLDKVLSALNAYASDVDPRSIKSIREVEQLMDKARKILTKIEL